MKISTKVRTVRRIVVFFDICSSTVILEDLLRTENELRWRNLLIGLKQFLVAQSDALPFEIYKFLGDGWILLFDDESTEGPALMNLLERLCGEYKRLLRRRISDVLTGDRFQIGLTFGIDSGKLVKLLMNQRDEYIGRALNVAARLQNAIKQKDKQPAGKLLISKNAFVDLRLARVSRYAGTLVDRNLSNLTGGECYQARKIVLWKDVD